MKAIITVGLLYVSNVIFAQHFTNNYMDQPYNAPKINVERVSIYAPSPIDWHYAHHPSIAYFKGKFIAIFSNGTIGEDEPGQRVLMSTSSDFFNWSTPTVLQDAGIAYELTPGGLLVANDDLLVAYFTKNDSTADFTRPNSRLFAMSTSDGINWSGPTDLGISIFPCHRPSILSSGRLLLTGNRRFFYTDDPTGLSGWSLAGDSPFLPGQSTALVEGAIIEHTDSVYTLFRDAGKRVLWQESSKDGASWGTPFKTTTFTNDDTKSHFGKLPDGRYYYVGTPDTLAFGNRTPLVLSTSIDGFNFDRNYIIASDTYQMLYPEGRAKGGQFGYPYSIIRQDSMYVIVSRRKEKIEVIRFSLSELGDTMAMEEKDISISPQIDGTKLPLDDGWAAGLITDPSSASLTGNGEIYISCESGESYTFQATPTTEDTFNPTGDYTIEFRLKVTANNGRGIDIYTRDGVSAHTLLCISTDRVFLNGGSTIVNLDATQYHVYRLSVRRSDQVMYFFIDGNFIRTINRSSNLNPIQLLFGKSNAIAATEAYLDYLAYDLTGAYQPSGTSSSVFQNIAVNCIANTLHVDWESKETDCEYYEIQVSEDGTNFFNVGRVNSKSVDGFSDQPIHYEFSWNLQKVTLLGTSLLTVMSALLYGWHGKKYTRVALFVGLSLLFFSCIKNHMMEKIRCNPNLSVRILQVSKGGDSSVSEMVRMNR